MIKKIVLFCCSMIVLSCSDNTQINDCFLDVNVSEVLNTRLPSYQLLTINGTSNTYSIGGRQIHIIRNNASDFIAFDLECPDRNCNAPLDIITNAPIITCTCHDRNYNYLQGGKLIGEEGCGMLMYTVNLIGSDGVQIRN
ncbi:Rieske 2Fe-2S domain-containing protein [Polaribacter sp. AHE13PA]|jgi:nitrite reductase/ring-hydroxylating ferredoxin subunit|uniref:Rieske 2Fe-2S domain-containing protein n=2 Tax=Polaribacter TaxID=52959 RepID=UPI001C4FFD4B|nr:Rieske 2Fe-2S domain-containing protein [Polaribacter sp. AHE13PA]QXP66527.1 Rieske 2Fe-2S domain-containing protein [Polaribacter sp. AHE13PA]